MIEHVQCVVLNSINEKLQSAIIKISPEVKDQNKEEIRRKSWKNVINGNILKLLIHFVK